MPGRRGYIWKGGGQAGCSGPIFHARYHFISEWEDLDREISIGKYLNSKIEVNLVWGIDKKRLQILSFYFTENRLTEQCASKVGSFPLKVNTYFCSAHPVVFVK